MSLYVGHIPPHVRPEDLERVFRRFGRCDLQLKDAYGFAVYQVLADAELALRTLRGKYICGAPISLNWSNQQPKPLQRSGRPNQIYEPPFRRRNIRGFEDQRDFPHGRHRDDVLDRGPGYDIEERRGATLKEGVTDEHKTSEPIPNPVANDRWVESVGDEFDRYEPYRGENRDEKDNNQMGSSYGSPYNGSTERKGRNRSIDEVDKKKFKNELPQPACYNCGVVGHIKRNCPEGDGRQEKFSKLRCYRDEVNMRERNYRKLKMPRTSSRGRLDANREKKHLISREGRETHLERTGKFVRRNESRPKFRAESQEKDRSRRHSESRKEVPKKRRRYDTSSLSSSSTSSSHSHSRTSKSKSHASSPLTSKSISSRSHSAASSSSRSASSSSYFKSNSSRSRSRSWSKSLYVSLDNNPSSSPKNVNLNVSGDTPHKGNLYHSVSPGAIHILHKNTDTYKVNNDINQEPPRDNGENVHYSASSSEYKENNSDIKPLKDDFYIKPVKDDFAVFENSEEKYEGIKNYTRITSEEMIVALKHYGLPVPEEGESGISVEGYFGAARVWPWEMIYYRRLKKAPISTENYARRLEQNREFGIVDKFIRSSSGWGEHEGNDPQ